MRIVCLSVVLLAFLGAYSQEYSYTHYDITEGLAGSTVYCITQDKEGYIWTGTETGLSRFDGVHFKNFTTEDGLPDIEILQIFADSRSRIWMAPFRRSLCYYYHGRIHNQENDSLLKRIHLQGNIEGFAENARGDVIILQRNFLYIVTAENVIRRLDSLDGKPIKGALAVGRDASGNFMAEVDGSLIGFSESRVLWKKPLGYLFLNPNYISMNPSWVIWLQDSSRTIIINPHTGKQLYHPFNHRNYVHVSYSMLDDSLAFENTFGGSIETNVRTGATRRFLPGKTVNRAFRDGSGSLWFATAGEGLFRLNSDEFKSMRLPDIDQNVSAVCSINKISNSLWVCDNKNYAYRFSLPDLKVQLMGTTSRYAAVRNLFIDSVQNNIIIGGDYDIVVTDKLMRDTIGRKYVPMKAACRISENELLIGSAQGAFIMNPNNLVFTDTLLKERTTTVFYHKDTIYLGTLSGVYRMQRSNPNQSLTYLGSGVPFLRKRISGIVESDDGIVWVGSFDDAGIIGYKNNKVVAVLTKLNGLTSNICKTLMIHNNELWVGTDKGVNRIELDQPHYPISRYTMDDGLGANMVNTLFADGRTIYVGTTKGFSFFDESKIDIREENRLYLQSVLNSGKEMIDDTLHLVLPYRTSNLQLQFAAISYRSVGNITYRYRLLGLDTSWRETHQTELEYPSLPSGNYTWQLQAVNKFGTLSRVVALPFTVETPFWKAWWFILLGVWLALFVIWLLVSWRIRKIRGEQRRKEVLMRKVGELENRAIQSQMNPHFIFNCLNSIQQFIFEQDIRATNKYISGFARLIRATLYNSSRAFITIADEVEYLSTYLTLEQMRFKDKMEYFIEVDPLIDRDNSLVPPMLIQPYVENSMRHGLRHKTKGKGYIRVKMRQDGELLVIEIEDNGIGRQKAMQFKTGEHIEYQSKGMSLTADRIRMIGAVYGADIKVQVYDLVDAEGEPSGTRVVMQLPPF